MVREFAAERQLVWDCYTKADLLNQWFAPKPFSTKTKSMEFRDGGHWHYAMVTPEGEEYWGYTEFLEISPIDFYNSIDAFSDKDGVINPDMPRAKWHVKFEDRGTNATVTTVVTYNSLNDLEAVINMGMKDGMVSTLEKLDELLVSLAQ